VLYFLVPYLGYQLPLSVYRYTIPINTKRELVTKVRDQEYVKAIMIAAIMSDVNWRKIPSFSEIPIWSTLAVLVRVFEA
jgi:hypothetical protein